MAIPVNLPKNNTLTNPAPRPVSASNTPTQEEIGKLKASIVSPEPGGGPNAAGGPRVRRSDKEITADKEAAALKEEVISLMSAEDWGELYGMPFDAAAIAYDLDSLALTKTEKIRCGKPLALLARRYLNVDPGIAAAIILAIASGQIITGKVILWKMEEKKRLAAKVPTTPARSVDPKPSGGN